MSADKPKERHNGGDGGSKDKLDGSFDWNVMQLNNRGFLFSEQGRLITIDDLKLAHEEAEGDQESLEKNFRQ